MSENFKTIYKILKILESSMDYAEFDNDRLSANSLGISESKRNALLTLMVEEGYIDGIIVTKYVDESYPVVRMNRPRITLKGLEYLENNSLMKKASHIAKGIVDVIT